MVALYRRLLTLPYIVANTILLWCLGLTLGLSERGSETLNVMKGIYGANILLIQTRADFTGTLTTTVPVSGERLESLQQASQASDIAFSTGGSRPTRGFAVVSAVVSQNYFSLLNYSLAQGRFSQEDNEVVVGSKLAELLEQRAQKPILNQNLVLRGKPYTVVGILKPILPFSRTDMGDNWKAFIPLEGFAGFDLVTWLYLRTNNPNTAQAQENVAAWLKAQKLDAFEVVPLLDTYKSEERAQAALLLDRGLWIATAAMLILGFYVTINFQVSKILERASILGIARACGANRWQIVLGEMQQGLRHLGLPVLLGGLGIWVVNGVFMAVFGLDAQPNGRVFALAIGAVVLLHLFSSGLCALWVYQLPIMRLVRGELSRPMRGWLVWMGLVFAVVMMVIQNSSQRSAIVEANAIIGQVGDRVATLSTTLSLEGFVDPRAPVTMTREDYQALRAKNWFSKIAFIENHYQNVQNIFTDIRAYEGDYLSLIGASLVLGRAPSKDAKEVIVGQKLADLGWKNQNPIGQKIQLAGEDFLIVGIYRSASQSFVGGARDDQILLQTPLAGSSIGQAILVEANAGSDINSSFARGADFLTQRHVSPDNQPIRALRPNALAPGFLLGLEQLARLLQWIVVLMLLMLAVSLFAQLWLWVLHHTAEIGVKRALGASKGKIQAEILWRNTKAALFSAALGCVLGLGVLWLQNQALVLDWWQLALTPLTPVLVAILATSVPAYLAAQIQPASAVRLK
jgi:ABC-type lipoprotein release transport system permease subunit